MENKMRDALPSLTVGVYDYDGLIGMKIIIHCFLDHAYIAATIVIGECQPMLVGIWVTLGLPWDLTIFNQAKHED